MSIIDTSLANPLQGKLDELLECFVKVYGEKYREDIKQTLYRTVPVFVDEITLDKMEYNKEQVKTLDKEIEDAYRQFYEVACNMTRRDAKPQTPPVSLERLKDLFNKDIEKDAETLKGEIVSCYAGIFGLKEQELQESLKNPIIFDKIIIEMLVFQDYFNYSLYAGTFSLSEMMEERERLVGDKDTSRKNSLTKEIFDKCEQEIYSSMISRFEEYFGEKLDRSDSFIDDQCSVFEQYFTKNLFEYFNGDAQTLRMDDLLFQNLKLMFKNSEVNEDTFKDALEKVGGGVKERLKQRDQEVDDVLSKYRGLGNESLKAIDRLDLTNSTRRSIQLTVDEFLEKMSRGEKAITYTVKQKDDSLVNLCIFPSHLNVSLMTIIHEINHAVNTSKDQGYKTGVAYRDNNKLQNRLINEVFNEYITLRIQRVAEKRGLKQDFPAKDSCADYALFFPLLGGLLREDFKEIIEASRSTNKDITSKIFGEKFNQLADELEYLYSAFSKNRETFHAYVKIMLDANLDVSFDEFS